MKNTLLGLLIGCLLAVALISMGWLGYAFVSWTVPSFPEWQIIRIALLWCGGMGLFVGAISNQQPRG